MISPARTACRGFSEAGSYREGEVPQLWALDPPFATPLESFCSLHLGVSQNEGYLFVLGNTYFGKLPFVSASRRSCLEIF